MIHSPVQKPTDPRRIADASLSDLRRLIHSRIAPAAPRFGTWLFRWCDNEQLRRVEMPDHARMSHAIGLPLDVRDWPDSDVGAAMLASTTLSLTQRDEAMGQWIDNLCLLFAGECSRRLSERKHDD